MPGRRLSRARIQRWLLGKLDTAGLLGLSRDDRDELAWQAARRLESGRPDEARRLFQLLGLLSPPSDPVGPLGEAVCLQAQGDLAGAEAGYDRALEAEPDHPYALANRAEVRLLTGRPEAALADLATALARLDRDPGGDTSGLQALRTRVERLRELAETGPAQPPP